LTNNKKDDGSYLSIHINFTFAVQINFFSYFLKMRKVSALIFMILFFNYSFGQTTSLPGKPITEIFTDFHYSFNDTSKTNGFGINRAYLGYKYLPEGKFSSTVIINVGTPEDLASGSKQRRYAYFREASIAYTDEKLTINFGIASTRIFDFQQKFWSKRYIGSEYQAIYGYGSVADLGIVVDYRINDLLKVDLTVMNGKGYSNIQFDNSLKTSFGLTVTTQNRLAFRLYGDVMKPVGVLQSTLIGFAGFKTDYLSLGVEASFKSNLDLINGHDTWGISGTGAVNLSEKTELFVRYDYATSVIPAGYAINWNYMLDGSFGIYGVQYTFSPNLRMALNYKGNYPYNTLRQSTDAIYLNVHFRF